MTKHGDRCRAAAKHKQEYPHDPTMEEIWGPVNPLTGLHMGGGSAETERANRKDRTDVVKDCDLKMLHYGFGKLIGND